MPRFEISGADRTTGDNHTFSLDAPTLRAAELAAKKRGLLVASVKEVGESPIPLPYFGPTAEPEAAIEGAPDYAGIKTGAKVLNLFGILSYIAGGISVFSGVVAFVNGTGEKDVGNAIALVVGGLSALASGAIFNMLAYLGLAIRDMARNSFRK